MIHSLFILYQFEIVKKRKHNKNINIIVATADKCNEYTAVSVPISIVINLLLSNIVSNKRKPLPFVAQ
jgi:hypothetical protein